MKTAIKPVGDKIMLVVESAKLGNIDTSSMKTGVEWGRVSAIGPEVTICKPGDKIFVKAWSIDTIDFEGEKYCFTSQNLKGVCAVVS